MTRQTTVPSLPPPDGCSEQYALGWRGAERWLRRGGELEGELPPEWDPELASGYRARLARSRNPEGGRVLTFKPRPRPA